jgi:ATP-dependent helicase/nuclease subunit B
LLLRFVAGRAGAGKSTWIYRSVKKDMEKSSLPVYIVVPEQFTLQTEKELIAALGAKGLMQARVVSPTRLAGEVFSRVERDRRAVVDESGLAMALRAAANGIAEELRAFRPVLAYAGFSSGMVKLISEMKRSDISPLDLLAAAAGARGALKAKAEDIAALYRRYDEYLSRHSYMDGDDQTNAFISALGKADFLKECNFYFDGFDYLTPQHCRLIGQLLAIASSVTLTLEFDAAEGEDANLFRAARENTARLNEIAGELGAEVKWTHVRTGERQRAMPADTAYLERRLFSARQAEAAAHRTGDVAFCRAADIEEEAEAAAAWIVEKVREGNLRWREAAVQCGDLAAYASAVGRVFSRYAIPCFIDNRKPLAGHPGVRFVLSLVRLAERDFRPDDALRLLKTGYLGMPEQASDRLEVYLAEFAPRGARAWSRDWAKGQDRYDLKELNDCRMAVYGAAQALIKNAGGRKATGEKWARAIYALLSERKFEELLETQAEELRATGFVEEAAVTERVWACIVDALDQLSEIMGAETLDVRELSGILQSGFDAMEAGILPTGVDQVQVGSIGRSKYGGLRHMLVIGAAEGSLSEAKSSPGILSDREIDAMGALGARIGRSGELKASQRRFALYESMTKGSEGLYVSWPASGAADGKARPDRIVERAMALLGIGPADVLDAAKLIGKPSAAGGSVGRLAALVRGCTGGVSPDMEQLALLRWYLENPAYAGRVRAMIDSAAGDCVAENLPAAGLLAGGSAFTASRLEAYGDCPFRHFVEYVLKPVLWRERGVEGADAGRFLHAAMERLGKRLAELRYDAAGIGMEGMAELMRGEAERLLGEFEYGLLESSARLKWTGGNLKRICDAAAGSYWRQLVGGSFVPTGQEITFGRGGLPAAPLAPEAGPPALLQGRIDRLDVYRAEDADWLRVVDYKSGRSGIDLYAAANGIGVQTWLYLWALRSVWGKYGGRPCRPAGAYVFPLADPWVEDGPDADEKRVKELRLKGWCLKDGEVIRAMDKAWAGGASEILSLTNRSGAFDETVVNTVLKIVEDNAAQSVGEIRSGRVAALPWRDGHETACSRCSYGAACRFAARAERKYRRLLGREEIDGMLGVAGEESVDAVDE